MVVIRQHQLQDETSRGAGTAGREGKSLRLSDARTRVPESCFHSKWPNLLNHSKEGGRWISYHISGAVRDQTAHLPPL